MATEKKQKTEPISVLLLGAGMVCKPLIHYLSERGYVVFVGSRTISKIEAAIEGATNAKAIKLDIESEEGQKKMDELMPQVSGVISLLPYVHHPKVAEYALKYSKHFFTSSYTTDTMRGFDEEAKKKNLVFINECGVDPGTDHMSAMRVIDSVRAKKGKITSFTSYCGGLPHPEDNNNPLGYKLSWAPRGVLLASKNDAFFLQDGEDKNIPGEILFDNYTQHEVPGSSKFECYPNRDSKSYIGVYGLKDAKTVIRGTLRNQGWCRQVKKLVDLGYLSLEETDFSTYSTFGLLLAHMIGSDAKDLKGDVTKKLELEESDKVLSTMEWLGLFSEDKIPDGVKTPLDALCHQMQSKMGYAPGERDMLVMNHTFLAEFEDGTKQNITSTLLNYGIKNGDTSMSRTVSLPLAITVNLVLTGKFTKPGLSIPTIPELYNPILNELEQNYSIKFVEKITTL